MDFSKLKSSIQSKVKEVSENQKVSNFASSVKKGFGEFSAKAKETSEEFKKNMAEHKALTDEAKAPIEGSIVRYQVIYLGGFPMKPQKKSNSLSLGFNIMEDRFIFKPEHLAKTEWFGDENLEVLYSQVTKFEIVKRQVSTTEALLGSGDTKDLEQLNNIEITYHDTDGNEHVLRVEMLTGVTVYGQATKCREMLDILREKKILNKLNKEKTSENTSVSAADEIKKYKDLLDSGIITQEEFDAKKKELLGL